jgi:hypothetical protein
LGPAALHLSANRSPQTQPETPRLLDFNEARGTRIVLLKGALVLEERRSDSLGAPSWRQQDVFQRSQAQSELLRWMFDFVSEHAADAADVGKKG